MKLSEKIIGVVENNGFYIDEVEKNDEYFYVEFGQFTPCGEDWWETVWFDGTDEGFIKSVKDRYIGFDVDEEVEIWIECRGKNGVPGSIKALVEDAEWKERTLGKLYDQLNELERDED